MPEAILALGQMSNIFKMEIFSLFDKANVYSTKLALYRNYVVKFLCVIKLATVQGDIFIH